MWVTLATRVYGNDEISRNILTTAIMYATVCPLHLTSAPVVPLWTLDPDGRRVSHQPQVKIIYCIVEPRAPERSASLGLDLSRTDPKTRYILWT